MTESKSDNKNAKTTRSAENAADGDRPSRFDPVDVNLKNPALAAVLGWLLPGAGHLYQGRYGKGVLFMVCILGTFFWGLAMGDGHTVYASWRPGDKRLYYAAQVNVGLAALPAIPQAMSMSGGGKPMLGDWMAPPQTPITEGYHDHKATWHEKLGFYFELGTLFTTVAGLLNLLAVYDAFAGPVFGPIDGTSTAAPPGSDEHPVGLVEGFTSGFGFFGGLIGLIVGLTLRGSLDTDSDWLGYGFAIVGMGVGWALGRSLQWTTNRVCGVGPTAADDEFENSANEV